MPRTETILRVFVASPGDVAEERASLEEVVREWNLTWSKDRGIRLDLIRWETHGYPNMGVDPQAVVNEQMGDDYDLFVGIMWTRFGTATEHAGSGTAEEFDRAYERFCKNPDQLRIMFYFNDAPITPSEIDPVQLASIVQFRNRLGEKGALYWSYKGLEEFSRLVRIHLSRQVQEWRKSWGTETKSEPSTVDIDAANGAISQVEDRIQEKEEAEEAGLLDLFESAEDSFEIVNEVVTRMSSAIESLGQKMIERTSDLTEMRSSQINLDVRTAKRVINRSAEDMEQFVARMNTEIPIFIRSYSQGIDAYVRALALLADFKPEDAQELVGALESARALKTDTEGALDSIKDLRTIVASFPRITTVFNRAKRHTVSVLDTLSDEMATAVNLTSEIEKTLEDAISDFQDS